MPPKPKFTREEIREAALNLVSQKGMEALTAKELGNALGSSARPIFTVFENMKELQDELQGAAMKRFENFGGNMPPGTPLFKQIGMKMVLFGTYEPKLYQLLFMKENRESHTFEDIFSRLGITADICIESIREDYKLDLSEAKMLFENMWIYTFGVGTLCATGACRFSPERLGEMLSTEFQAMMLLITSGKGKQKQ